MNTRMISSGLRLALRSLRLCLRAAPDTRVMKIRASQALVALRASLRGVAAP